MKNRKRICSLLCRLNLSLTVIATILLGATLKAYSNDIVLFSSFNDSIETQYTVTEEQLKKSPLWNPDQEPPFENFKELIRKAAQHASEANEVSVSRLRVGTIMFSEFSANKANPYELHALAKPGGPRTWIIVIAFNCKDPTVQEFRKLRLRVIMLTDGTVAVEKVIDRSKEQNSTHQP